MPTEKKNTLICAYDILAQIRKQCVPNFILVGYYRKALVIFTDLSFSEIVLPSGCQYITDDDGEHLTYRDTDDKIQKIKIIRPGHNLF